jgi:lipoprotein LpqH
MGGGIAAHRSNVDYLTFVQSGKPGEGEIVKYELWVAIGAAAIAVGGVAACSNDDDSSSTSSTPASSSSSAASSASATASASVSSAAGSAVVTIDGQPRNVDGQVVCATNDGKFSIAIGDMITGVIVGLEPDGSAVHNVGLGDVNGAVLSFTEGVPGNNASATKDGNHYKVTGTATGVENANPTQQVSKPFVIDATCP